MQSTLRFLQLLTMAFWVGGLAFFAFVLAPTAFHTLPSTHIAGLLVGASLKLFDLIALTCGGLFLASTALMFRRADHRLKGRYEIEFFLALVMLLATSYLHWNILPRMDADRAAAGGDITTAAPSNPARIHFDRLHVRSERVAGTVLFLGLAVLFLMSREQLPPSEPSPFLTAP